MAMTNDEKTRRKRWKHKVTGAAELLDQLLDQRPENYSGVPKIPEGLIKKIKNEVAKES